MSITSAQKNTIKHLLGALALAALPAFAGCGGDGGGNGNDAGNTQDSGVGNDVVTSPCGATGVFGTFTNVNGGESGVTACGHSFTAFTGATLTITQTDSGGALLTVTGTGDIGDTTNCPATVDNTTCTVTAAACASGSGSTVTYSLHAYAVQVSGTASPSLVGDCTFSYSIDGSR